MLIEVSLTAFMNYLNSSGTKKISAIQKAKEDSLNSFEPHKDYWFKFRQKVAISFGAREKRQNGLNHSKGIGAKESCVFPLILKCVWNTGVKSI